MKLVKLFIAHDVDEELDLEVFAVEFPLTLADETVDMQPDGETFGTVEVHSEEELKAWAERQPTFGSYQILEIPVDPAKHADYAE